MQASRGDQGHTPRTPRTFLDLNSQIHLPWILVPSKYQYQYQYQYQFMKHLTHFHKVVAIGVDPCLLIFTLMIYNVVE